MASYPEPHTCSSTRITRGENYTTPAAVLSEEPCLISSWFPGEVQGNLMGPLETNKFVMFVGFDADVQMGDEITNDATAEVYIVTERPTKWPNPSNGFANDHQQVIMKAAPVS